MKRALIYLTLILLTIQVQAANYRLDPLWSLAPGDRTYLTSPSSPFQRGMAYNPVTGHVLIVDRTDLSIHILDGATGADLGMLAIGAFESGGTTGFALNLIAVADDGAIYAGNLSNSTSQPLYNLYRWADESSPMTLAFGGGINGGADPGLGNIQRWGDTMAIRGAGTNTQILLGSRGTIAAILTTSDGSTFISQPITLDTPPGATGFGVSFGTGNTFWATAGLTGDGAAGSPMRYFSFNLGAGTATTLRRYDAPPMKVGITPIAVDPAHNMLATVVGAATDTVDLYDIANVASVPVLYDSKPYATTNANSVFAGAVSFSTNNILYALDGNNGISAFTITAETNAAPSIVGQSPNLVVIAGSNATFSVSVKGATPMSYQWYKNPTPITGATNSIFTITNAQNANAGTYSVIVTNISGAVTSANATLVITEAPSAVHLNIYEPFDYTVGDLLSGKVYAGQTWAINGTGDDTRIAAGSISIPGLKASTGQSITNGGAGAAVRLPLGINIASGTLYYSFAMRVDDVGAAFNTTSGFIAAFINEAANLQHARLNVRAASGGYNLGITKISGTPAWAPDTYTAGQTLFIVGSYTFNSDTTSDDVAKLWINPDPSSFGSGVVPPPTMAAPLAGTDIAYIDRFTIRQNTAGNTMGTIVYDELRVDTTWAAVTPLPVVNVPVPTMSITHADSSSAVISWPTNSTGFALEGNANLSTTNWTAVPNTVVVNGTNNTVTVSTSSGNQFFRLKK